MSRSSNPVAPRSSVPPDQAMSARNQSKARAMGLTSATGLPGRQVASLICQVKVAADDPAFEQPTKFIGPVYPEAEGRRLAGLRGWQIRPDGLAWRRVVASPEPRAIVELPTIAALVSGGAIVICAGGGGIPVLEDPAGRLHGAEAVIDKDLSAALLARDLGADALVILTDVANVETGFGTDVARPIGRTTPAALRALKFPAGSMGPKVEAACRFVEATGKPAMLGQLDDAAELVRGTRGTVVEPASRRSGESAVPVVSFAFALCGNFPWRRVPAYVAAQFAGSVLAVSLLWALVG